MCLYDTFDVHVTLQWIPGHAEIPGNEYADKLAKRGANMPQPQTEVSASTMNRMVTTTTRERWMNRWAAGDKGRAVYREMSKPNTKDASNKLSRREQCIIFQLRTQHCHLNFHCNRMNPENPPNCRQCSYAYETVKHFLLDCPGLTPLRQELLPFSTAPKSCRSS